MPLYTPYDLKEHFTFDTFLKWLWMGWGSGGTPPCILTCKILYMYIKIPHPDELGGARMFHILKFWTIWILIMLYMYFQLTDAADSLHVILHWHCPNKRGFMLSCITYQLHDAVKETQIIILFLLDIVKLLSCKKAHSKS